jgi:hypothetical protein
MGEVERDTFQTPVNGARAMPSMFIEIILNSPQQYCLQFIAYVVELVL